MDAKSGCPGSGRSDGGGCAGLPGTHLRIEPEERRKRLPDDEPIAKVTVQSDHAIMIDAPPAAVGPRLVQKGWGRGAWYSARWVDRLLLPESGLSAKRILQLQDISVGTFIPDGHPETKTGLHVLESNSHLPMISRGRASLDWKRVFVLTPVDGGQRTRYHFRSRWVTRPWWSTLGGWLGVVPADFLMSRDDLRGVK